jgi:hypothetical protein
MFEREDPHPEQDRDDQTLPSPENAVNDEPKAYKNDQYGNQPAFPGQLKTEQVF